jgi:hypothetical protein
VDGDAAPIPLLNALGAAGDPTALLLIPLALAMYLMARGLWSAPARREGGTLRRIVEDISRLAEAVDKES